MHHRSAGRELTIDFWTVAQRLNISHKELANLIAGPYFPKPIRFERRGIWRVADIDAWQRRTQQLQSGRGGAA